MSTHARSDDLVPDDETPGSGAGGLLSPEPAEAGFDNAPLGGVALGGAAKGGAARGEAARGEAAKGGAARGEVDRRGEPLDGGQAPSMAIAQGARLVVRFVRLHPGPFALSIIGGVGWAVMLVAASELLGWVTDNVIEPAFSTGVDPGTLRTGVIALVAVGFLRGLTVVVRRWFGSITESRMQRSLRREVVDKLLVMRMDSYRSRPTGTLLATSDVDVTTATQMLMPLPFSLGVVALVVVSLASLWRSDPAFALVALVLFPVLAWLSRYYTNRIHEPSARVQERLGEVSAIAHESFDGVLAVKTLARERAESERFDAASALLARERIGLARMTAVFEPMITMLPNLGMVVLVVTGAVRLEAGAATVGDLVQAVALFGWLAFPMRVVGFLFQTIPRAVVSIARVDDLLAEPDDPLLVCVDPDAVGGDLAGRYGAPAPMAGGDDAGGEGRVVVPVRHLPTGPLSLELHDVGFSFDGQVVLRSVAFRVEPGEVVAVVGSTGSGKSTLVGLLAHLDEPTGGEVLLGGVSTVELDPAELRAAVSVAFQESYLFAESVADNVALGRDVDGEAIEVSLRRSVAEEFVHALPSGVHTVVGERGVTLSGGQRQRVALARALAGDPRVVVLDDATSAVDPVIESRILQSLREGDTTMLIVAHRLSTILLADRVVHLAGGRVRGIGTHAELMHDPAYVALVRAYEDGPSSGGPAAGPAAGPAVDPVAGPLDGFSSGGVAPGGEGVPP